MSQFLAVTQAGCRRSFTRRLLHRITTPVIAAVVALVVQKADTQRVNADQASRPNIVFLLADDLGWTGLRCFGSDFYETPNLDRLASEGMKFPDAYSACTVCSPTRASIMTGKYPARLHLTDFIAGQNRPFAKLAIPDWTKRLDRSQRTIANVLSDAGYRTFHVGKWHLSPVDESSLEPGTSTDDFSPSHRGFAHSIEKPSQAKGYLLPEGFNRDGESGSDYVTDYLTDQALRLIDEHHAEPFFLYFAYHTPHTPIQGRPDLVAAFEKKVNPQAVHHNPEYAAMVSSLDTSVGRILERLDQWEISENTIVIFTSDNGGLTQRNGKHDDFTENIPLRRGKGSAYEGGVRVPTIVRLPGVTQPGSVCSNPIITIDYFPTLCDLAGVDRSGMANIDGHSLVPLLHDPTASLDRSLYWHYPHYHAGGDGPYSAVRRGPWRLIEFFEDERRELYNLANDLSESTDLSSQQSELANELHADLVRWRNSVGAQMPRPNPSYDPDRADRVVGGRE